MATETPSGTGSPPSAALAGRAPSAARAPRPPAAVAERPARRPRNTNGMGGLIRKVDAHGYVTFKPRVIVDGITYWGEGVGVGRVPGLSPEECERRARLRADQNRKKLLRAVDRNEHQDVAHRRATLSGVIDEWWREIEGSRSEPSTKKRKQELLGVLRPHVGTVLPSRLVLLRPQHVRALHQALRDADRASSTMRGVHDLLLQILRWASRQGMPVYGPLLEGAVERPGHRAREKRSVSVGVSVRDLAEMLRSDPAVALRYQHWYVAKLKREARKIGRAIERGRAAAGKRGTAKGH